MNLIVGKRIKELRKIAGLSQEKLARKIAVDRTFISKIESGKINLTIHSLSSICRGLEITLSDFFSTNLFS